MTFIFNTFEHLLKTITGPMPGGIPGTGPAIAILMNIGSFPEKCCYYCWSLLAWQCEIAMLALFPFRTILRKAYEIGSKRGFFLGPQIALYRRRTHEQERKEKKNKKMKVKNPNKSGTCNFKSTVTFKQISSTMVLHTVLQFHCLFSFEAG